MQKVDKERGLIESAKRKRRRACSGRWRGLTVAGAGLVLKLTGLLLPLLKVVALVDCSLLLLPLARRLDGPAGFFIPELDVLELVVELLVLPPLLAALLCLLLVNSPLGS